MNNIARVFMDCHMGWGFQGLGKVCKQAKVNLSNLGDGDFIIFLNRKCTSFKLLAGQHYLVYYKHSGRIPLEAIRHLPSTFGGSKFEFDKAVEKALRSKINFEA